MVRKLLTVTALAWAVMVVSGHDATAQGRFLDAAKATAGVIVAGSVACALTSAFIRPGFALCTPFQMRQTGYYPHPTMGVVRCPAGTVWYDATLNRCYFSAPVAPVVRATAPTQTYAPAPTPTVRQGSTELAKLETVFGTCLPGQVEVEGTPQNSTCTRVGDRLRCKNVCQDKK